MKTHNGKNRVSDIHLSKSKVIKVSTENISDQLSSLLDFSLSEFSSGIELSQSSKRVDDSGLCCGLLRHAIDEYRHMGVFKQIAQNVAYREKITGLNPFLSRHVLDKRYVDPHFFLIEKMSFAHFAIFVHTNERYASKHLEDIIKNGDIFTDDEIIQLKSIMTDEIRHIGFSGNFVDTFRLSNPFKSRGLELWERLDLVRRNIQIRSQGFYNFVSRMILSVGLVAFVLLTRVIEDNWTNDISLKQSLSEAERMV